ncbi:2Fe-2S iron-sulfur cluster-binding protein [Candidatus Zixiibacteriota bacterium]
MISLTIDGHRGKIQSGATILQAARKLGIEIPTICHHPAMEPYAACRICMVEIVREGRSDLVTSCNTAVQRGMTVRTRSKKVFTARRTNLELLMAQAPAAKIVRALAARYGIKNERFPVDRPEEDCVLCGLCVRVCESVVGVSAICFANRGANREVTTPFDQPSDVCIACGACTFLCPTGAVQMEAETVEQFRQKAGPIRECRYSLMGILPYALCANSFRCATCEVDQRFRDSMETHPIFVARDCQLESVAVYQEFVKRIRKE